MVVCGLGLLVFVGDYRMVICFAMVCDVLVAAVGGYLCSLWVCEFLFWVVFIIWFCLVTWRACVGWFVWVVCCFWFLCSCIVGVWGWLLQVWDWFSVSFGFVVGNLEWRVVIEFGLFVAWLWYYGFCWVLSVFALRVLVVLVVLLRFPAGGLVVMVLVCLGWLQQCWLAWCLWVCGLRGLLVYVYLVGLYCFMPQDSLAVGGLLGLRWCV